MRILLITHRPYLPQQVGGREMAIHETAQALLQSGHEPIVMCGLEPGNFIFYKNRIRSKLTTIEYPEDRLLGYPVFRGWTWQCGLMEISRKYKPAVAVVECTSLQYLDALGELGIPAVLRLHDMALHTLGGDPRRYGASRFIAVSSYLADKFESRHGFRPIVLPPLVRKQRCVTETTRKTVVFANPRPVKGGDLAIEIAKNCPDIHFQFFQAWTMDDTVRSLQEQARKLENVQWRPSVMDARELYREARIVLIPSRADETWGRMATEAHFNGIPVIASRRGGLIESVGTGGILLDPDASTAVWTDAVRRLWDDRDYYDSLSQSALSYSRRKEISTEWIMAEFLRILQNAETIGTEAKKTKGPGLQN